ncbi:MAG: hypothetical protein ACMUHM_02635 [Thermoplasmatota archaeon]
MEKKGSKKKKEVEFDEDDDEEDKVEKKKVEVDEEEDEEEEEDEDDEEDFEEEEEEEEEDEDDDEDLMEEDEDDEEDKPKKKSKSKKKGSELEGKAKTAAMLAKIGMFCGIFAVAGLLIRIILDVLNWVIPGIWCLTCLLWPVFALGFLAALAAIGFGVAKIVMDSKGDKKIAIISIALGAGYIVLAVVWAIASFVIGRFV